MICGSFFTKNTKAVPLILGLLAAPETIFKNDYGRIGQLESNGRFLPGTRWRMKYSLINAVWEITYMCNMRCKHCGSGCGEKYPDELSTAEALGVSRQLGELGLKQITLSGGEPFMRPDLTAIVKSLVEQGIHVSFISNGWYIDASILDSLNRIGRVQIAVSLDGLETTHDYLRKKDSFDRVLNALKLMKEKGISSTVVTTVNRKNIPELPELKKHLYDCGVRCWQFQLATPMGNLLDHPELIPAPEDCERIIDFAFETAVEKKIIVDIGDNIGYFHSKITSIRKMTMKGQAGRCAGWMGCSAGKRGLGIRANGDIVGCLSIRDDRFIEGNIRETALAGIWNDPDSFSWNRSLSKEKLEGFCGECQYGSMCLGGCSLSKTMFCGSLSENTYCLFRTAIRKEERTISQISNPDVLRINAAKCIESESYQLADIYFKRIHLLAPEDGSILEPWAYVHFRMKNYARCKELNCKAIETNPENCSAWKGYGISLVKTGDIEEGLRCLRKAVSLADGNNTDPFHDLAVILHENGRTGEALEVLEEGMRKFPALEEKEGRFYQILRSSLPEYAGVNPGASQVRI